MTTDLVVKAQAGDEEAFMALAESVADRFHAVADRILRDSHLAEDATQQALTSMWRDLPRLRDPSRFEAWSYRLLVNACYSEVRSRRRHLPTLPVEWSRDSGGSDEFAGVVDRDQLERGFRRLSVEHRAILVLHHYLGLTLPQIADALDIPIGTVNSRLSRAVGRMRLALQVDAPPAAPRTATQEVER